MEYEGTFEANMLEGRGVYYTEVGDLIYKGDFHDGMRSGHGIEFYHTGGKLYEGEWLGDAWQGSGAWFNILGDLIHRGYFMNGKPCRSEFTMPKNEEKIEKVLLNSPCRAKNIELQDKSADKTFKSPSKGILKNPSSTKPKNNHNVSYD